MVDLKKCNEVAILFIIDNEVSDKNFQYFIPDDVIEGYYDIVEDVFYDVKGDARFHISICEAGRPYGKRITFAELFAKYPNMSLEEAKKKYLEEIKEKQYYFDLNCLTESDEVLIKAPLFECDSKTGEVSEYYDENLAEDNMVVEIYDLTFDENNNLIGVERRDDGEVFEDVEFEEENSYALVNVVSNEPKDVINVKEMYDEITKCVIGQEEAIRKILSTFWLNFNTGIDKTQNIFVNGPTGVGKTETFRIIADMLNIPITIQDCNDFTAAGYIGRDVSEILVDLLKNANSNVELAQRGIVVLDEVDKIALKNPLENVGTSGVQDALLKILEDKEVLAGKKKLNTKLITFVGLGAFSDIEKMTPKRVGFGVENKNLLYSEITPDDIISYGIKAEFIGRFQSLVSMNALTQENLSQILVASNLSPLKRRQELYKGRGIELLYNDSFIEEVAKKAKKLNLGARGLQTIIEQSLFEAQLEMAFANDEFKTLEVTGETVNDPKKYILKR